MLPKEMQRLGERLELSSRPLPRLEVLRSAKSRRTINPEVFHCGLCPICTYSPKGVLGATHSVVYSVSE